MIRPIVKDPVFLMQKSVEASEKDVQIAIDLKDTLLANKGRCVGMAANMIGHARKIIAFEIPSGIMIMFNPEIIHRNGPYTAEEGCLSLTGARKTTRYRTIEVSYQDQMFKKRKLKFSGYTAQIIQHEIDHCSGIII